MTVENSPAPLTEEEIIAMADRYGLDCDYVAPKYCAFRGTDRCCQREVRNVPR